MTRLALAGSVVACLLVTSPGARALPARTQKDSSTGSDFGPFGGYIWTDPVHSIGASWAVPAITNESREGLAATYRWYVDNIVAEKARAVA